MSLDLALRATEILLAIAFLQSSAEHMATPAHRALFIPRLILSVALLLGIQTPWVCAALMFHSLMILHRFQGPYNGGSDRMGLLILSMLCLAHLLPTTALKEAAFGYLAAQVILSYAISGWVKITNPDWRSGRALSDVFTFSAYPVSESLRGWANRPTLLMAMSWAVFLFELIFPLCLLTQPTLIAALIIAMLFHLANGCLFGLNRFVWTWAAAYPSLIWLQDRAFGTL